MARRRTAGLAAVMILLTACSGSPSPPGETQSATPITAPPATLSATPATSPAASATASPIPTRTTNGPPAPTPTPPAVCAIPANLAGRDLISLPTTSRVIALTFDGGATNAGTARILETLDNTATPATFFLTGDFAQDYPEDSRRIAARYPVGNHTQDHPDLTALSDEAVQNQIRTGQASIKEVTGIDPRPYFRFPFGAVDARTIRLVNDECYVPFRWTVDTLGWQGTSGGMSAAKVTQRVLDGASPGGIILMHLGDNPTDRSTLDADALPGIITGLKEKGYAFVALEHALPATP